jgi:hypothetical protein
MLAFLGGGLFAYFIVSAIFLVSLYAMAFVILVVLDLYDWLVKPKKQPSE